MTKYILLDTETTGTSDEDRIIQLGFIVLEGKNAVLHNDYCNPGIPIATTAMEVHGITPEDIKHKPTIEETSSFKMLNAINTHENFLLIHNAPFDLGMLKKERFEPQMQVVDTLRCARHLFPEEEAHRLQYFRYKLGLYKKEADEAKKLGIEVRAHDAIGDVLVLKLFMRSLLEQLPSDMDFHDKMKKLVRLSTEPVLVRTPLRFGKHKGLRLTEIVAQDRGYLEWMLKNMEDLDSDIRFTITSLLS